MSHNFARHEQFLRIFALLNILAEARQPLDDQALISTLRDRLGLSRLSARTLRRDCEFLVSCGYPVDHKPIPGTRKFGWQLLKQTGGRPIPSEPVTLLEMVAFTLGRELLRVFEGTVIWTGIETLWHKISRNVPETLMNQLDEASRGFFVHPIDQGRYANRPRLLSTLSSAITDRREIDVEQRSTDSGEAMRHRLQPHCLIIQPQRLQLLAFAAVDPDDQPPMLIDLEQIEKVVTTDAMFTPRSTAVARFLESVPPLA